MKTNPKSKSNQKFCCQNVDLMSLLVVTTVVLSLRKLINRNSYARNNVKLNAKFNQVVNSLKFDNTHKEMESRPKFTVLVSGANDIRTVLVLF